MRSRDPGSWMWAEALELLHTAERLQRQFFQLGSTQDAPGWVPPVDFYETGDLLWIVAALPGVGEEQLAVAIEDTELILRGERPLPRDTRGAVIHRLEIPYGRFERRIGLPEGQYQVVERKLENGCLVICLRRAD